MEIDASYRAHRSATMPVRRSTLSLTAQAARCDARLDTATAYNVPNFPQSPCVELLCRKRRG